MRNPSFSRSLAWLCLLAQHLPRGEPIFQVTGLDQNWVSDEPWQFCSEQFGKDRDSSLNWFYEDLPSRTNTKKLSLFFIRRDRNAKVGSQEIPWVTGKFGLRVKNGARQSLTEFCQDNTLVTANTLFPQHKRWFYTWTSPDGQYQNQMIIYSWRSRYSCQNKTWSWLRLRPWAPYFKIQAYIEESRKNY